MITDINSLPEQDALWYIRNLRNKPRQVRATVAQKTAPMFAHFGKIGMVRSSDISKKSDIII